MASYKGVQGALVALENFFKRRLPAELGDEPVSASVELLGSADIAETLSGNLLGIYLHEISSPYAPTHSGVVCDEAIAATRFSTIVAP